MLNRRRFLAGGAATAVGAATAAPATAVPGPQLPRHDPAAATPAAPGSNAAAAGRSAGDIVTVLPGDPRYPDLTVGNNARWVGRPDQVRLVTSTDQVVRAVQQAVEANRRISVRGGGHCYADFVFHPEAKVVIDTSGLNRVWYDQELRAFAVEAGANLLNTYDALYKGWGVTIPGGMCYSVGVGGHICGGGYGLLSRSKGLTVDHLWGVEVVTVNAAGQARAVLATREPNDPNRPLWWAHTGGGGGNFGIVTKYLFRSPGVARGGDPSSQLVRPPGQVLVSALGLPWSALDETGFASLVRRFGAFHERNSAPTSPYNALCSFLMMNHQANGSVGLLTVIDADVPNADVLLRDYLNELTAELRTAPLRQATGDVGPLPDLFQPRRLPWLTSMKLLGTSNPTLTNPALRGAHKSAYLKKGFTSPQIAAMYRHLTRTDHVNPASMVVLLSYGGRINTVAPDATAAAQRDSVFKALYQSFWTEPSEDTANIGWTREVFGEVFKSTGGYPVPNDVTDGCYINYPDADITDPSVNTSGVPWSTLYYKQNYPRLQRIKAAYDPRNIFRHSQSIRLP